MPDIGTLGGAGHVQNALNHRGQIAGWSFTNQRRTPRPGYPTPDPFLWQNGHMRDLGTLGGSLGFGNWLNNARRRRRPERPGRRPDGAPVPLERQGHMIDLGTLGGDFGAASYVNEQGDIAGWPPHRTNRPRRLPLARRQDRRPAARRRRRQRVRQRRQRPGPGRRQRRRQPTSTRSSPRLWSDGHGYDLNTLVAPNPLQMISADYIDDHGDIVGHGVTARRQPAHVPADPQPVSAATDRDREHRARPRAPAFAPPRRSLPLTSQARARVRVRRSGLAAGQRFERPVIERCGSWSARH